jgi:hypothetical protein
MQCRGCGECEATGNGYCESCNEFDSDPHGEKRDERMAAAAHRVKEFGAKNCCTIDVMDAMMYHIHKLQDCLKEARHE